MTRLQGKIALITGGTTGIGRETARLFRDEGATVIVTGNNPDNVTKVAAELGIEAHRSDASSLSDIESLIADIQARHGRLDVVMANAGYGGMRPIPAVDAAYFDEMFGMNVRGLYFLVQKALPLMHEGGSIILVASVAAHVGAVGGTIYAATKAAVRSLGRGFAAELAPRKIRVNTLTPGPIDTPLMAKSGAPKEVVQEMMVKMVPLGRMGLPSEAASAALYMASDESSFMTAGEIKIAGGMTDI